MLAAVHQPASAVDSDSVAANGPCVSATLDTVSDRGGSDAVLATAHTAAATVPTSPDTASVLPKSAAQHCLGSLVQSRILLMMSQHWRLS